MKLKAHVRGSNSSHNLALKKGENLLRQEKHIDNAISKCSDYVRGQYKTWLNASIDSIRYLLRQELTFHVYNESSNSRN